MKTTAYFEEQVLRKRPYLRREWCESALSAPTRVEVQDDGRYRFWAFIPDCDFQGLEDIPCRCRPHRRRHLCEWAKR